MPKLWTETIEAHRHAVHDAILDTAWRLVAEHGVTSVTMSQIAKGTGIGRATLYKYFPDVESILFAQHQRHIAGHLQHLVQLRDLPGDAMQRLEAVLEAYAFMSHQREHRGSELAALLHRGEQLAPAQQQLTDLVRDLLTDVAQNGQLRDDVSPDELATYCLHALTAANSLPSETSIRRLVKVTLDGLRPPSGPG
ncbi:MAG: TetR family transcriptional regulator [Nitriliruptorales bacterium]|nr:TetR family transcriptional regulator [Nitriliruptorales bacterium]